MRVAPTETVKAHSRNLSNLPSNHIISSYKVEWLFTIYKMVLYSVSSYNTSIKGLIKERKRFLKLSKKTHACFSSQLFYLVF